jgi:signal transduction histidine kinase
MIKKISSMYGDTKREIKIHGKYQRDLWTAGVEQGQIERVLLSLYDNGRYAMPGGGDLYVETINVNLDESYCKPYHIEPGKYVKISITDTGVGMDKATQRKIFDPFFSTKEMGRGTGLGLASVYGIIRNHGGMIFVYSEKGRGTTFSIYLRACEEDLR